MKAYMRAMTKIVQGSAPGSDDLAGFDPKFVQVYRNNSASALCDVIGDNFKTVANLVGPEYFAHLARAYIEKYPAKTRTLVGYGAEFPAFLDIKLTEHKLPYLSSFALLDRAWTRAHIAADAPAMQLEALAEIHNRGGDLESQKLALMPHVHLLNLDWPVLNPWDLLRRDAGLSEGLDLAQTKQYVLIWRYDNEVHSKILTESEFRFLSALGSGETLGQATAAALTLASPDDIAGLLPNMLTAKLISV